MEWLHGFSKFLESACEHYERSAPTVAAYLNDLYIRIGENADIVRLSEIATANRLRECGEWMHPNYAANTVYHLMNRLGMDTTGQTGF